MPDKILLVAPHPFFQERGTPIAVELLIRALSERGYSIDLLTFNEGTNIDYPGLTIYRVSPFPDITGVLPGFSIKKILLDILVFFKQAGLMYQNKYKVVHAVEESAFMAALLCPIFKVPYIFDMDSSMTTQLIDKMPALGILEKPLRFLESIPMRYANIVIPVCQALADEAQKYRSEGIYVLKDVSLANSQKNADSDIINIRNKYHIEGTILLYIGNLETYQGIDLMLKAFALYAKDNPTARLVVIGGVAEHISLHKNKCTDLCIDQSTIFMGKQPIAQINDYMTQADILLSPRTQGVNTPMKVYSYLDSGVALLATNLPTHTQVADNTTAYLTDPTPSAYAEGMSVLSTDSELRQLLAKNAKALIAREHSYPVYQATLYKIYDALPTKR